MKSDFLWMYFLWDLDAFVLIVKEFLCVLQIIYFCIWRNIIIGFCENYPSLKSSLFFPPKNKSVNFDEWWLAHSKLTWHFGLGVRRLGEGEFCPKKLSLCSPPPQCIMVNSLAVATPSGHIFFFWWWWWSPWCHNARCWP